MSKSIPSITIIGAGAVGSAWLDFFRAEGFPIHSVWRSETGYLSDEDYNIHRELNRPLPVSNEEIGDWVFITTPDDSIAPVVKILSDSDINWKQKTVFHCSGSMSASVLDRISEKGAAILSVHPIQTFQRGDGRDKLQNIYISLQGDQDVIGQMEELITNRLHSTPLILNEDQKKAVHVSAVFASNYLVALLHTSDQLLHDSGITEGVNILEPLIRQTLHNILYKSARESLTGPIARGDVKTVQDHLQFLGQDDEAANLYRALGQICVQLSKERGTLTKAQIKKIEELLLV